MTYGILTMAGYETLLWSSFKLQVYKCLLLTRQITTKVLNLKGTLKVAHVHQQAGGSTGDKGRNNN